MKLLIMQFCIRLIRQRIIHTKSFLALKMQTIPHLVSCGTFLKVHLLVATVFNYGLTHPNLCPVRQRKLFLRRGQP
jgi:hypothetical protein